LETIDNPGPKPRRAKDIGENLKSTGGIDSNHDEEVSQRSLQGSKVSDDLLLKSGDTTTARVIPQLYFPPRPDSSPAGKGSAFSVSETGGEELDLKVCSDVLGL
jgi:hypothetical protein